MNGKKTPSVNSSEYEDASRKETSYVKKLVKSASVNLSHNTQSNTRIRPISRVDRDNLKKEDHASKVVKLKSKSMGSTVSKIVAAFSNGVPLS